MPAENLLPLIGILAFFGIFAGVLAFGDLTWQPQNARKR